MGSSDPLSDLLARRLLAQRVVLLHGPARRAVRDASHG